MNLAQCELFFLHHHIDIWMLVTLFKATNQPIGLCSTIYRLTVNSMKKCYFSLGADLLKGFHFFVKIFNLGMLQKNPQFVQVQISACTVCLIANLAEHT